MRQYEINGPGGQRDTAILSEVVTNRIFPSYIGHGDRAEFKQLLQKEGIHLKWWQAIAVWTLGLTITVGGDQ
jgi:hypothetical protein